MKIAFIGSIDFSQRALELLIEMKLDIVGVCTLERSTFNASNEGSTPSGVTIFQ